MSKSNSTKQGRPIWPEATGSHLVSSIQMSAAYTARDPDALDDIYEGRAGGYTYSREGHPNADVLATMLDGMEGLSGGVVTGSGMSAVLASLLVSAENGDHIIGGDQLYGRTLRLFREDLPKMGIHSTLVDPTDVTAVEAAIRPETRAILIEVVSNPTLRIADVHAIAELAKARGITLIIDNTFTTPLGFSPVDAGADIVVHSITKMLAGHSDVMLGYVGARDPDLNARLKVLATTFGLSPSPMECWIAERGMLTFKLRFEQATKNAAALADALGKHSGVKQVIYPGRGDHLDAARSESLLSACNMVSFRIANDRGAANRLTRAVAPIAFAPTLGDVTTTLSHAASSSHRILTTQQQADLGIDEGFFRVSVGIEDSEYLIERFMAGVDASLA